MQPFTKQLRLGVLPLGENKGMSVYCTVEYTRDGRLSITGVEGPMANGNARGSCGQISMHLKAEQFTTFAKGWDAEKVAEFLRVWDAWHLNDMKAGTPEQSAAIEEWTDAGNKYKYGAACEHLKERGLYEVPDPRDPTKTYRYGTAWLTVEVPEEVLAWLHALPDADRLPPACWLR